MGLAEEEQEAKKGKANDEEREDGFERKEEAREMKRGEFVER